ncbi:MAG: cytochrome c-type biogenesis protein CcmH [Chloroflexota bacterium]
MIARTFTVLLLALLATFAVYAQDDTTTTTTATQDDVDEVASSMFCPVCENEPLDQCYNATCIQWKREIQNMLSQGMTPEEIQTSFVDRYGQHVVSVPHDPFLRALSFGAPILGTIIALIIGFFTFRSWQQQPKPQPQTSVDKPKNDNYRSQIERDLMQS